MIPLTAEEYQDEPILKVDRFIQFAEMDQHIEKERFDRAKKGFA